jgi:uncharacterized protein (TIGR01244 family)
MDIARLSATTFVSGQVTVSDLREAAAAGIRSVVNNRPDGESPDQPSSNDLASAARELGLDYVYLPVVAGQMTRQDVLEFKQVYDALQEPVLLFCRSGARSAALWQTSQQMPDQQ